MHAYRLGLLALAATTVLGSGLRAETPEIEVYVGTRRVVPKPVTDPSAGPRAIAGLVSTMQSATGSAFASTSRVVSTMMERALPRWERPQIPVVVNVTVPPPPAPSPLLPTGAFQPTGLAGAAGTPGLLPWVKANATHELVPVQPDLRNENTRGESQPTVIVVREHAGAMLPTDSTGIRISNELLLGVVAVFGVGLIGTILLVAVRPARSSRHALSLQPMPLAVAAGHVAVGGRDAGPMPPAEKFDLGPTYAEQIAQNQMAQKAGEDAMLLNILDQNLTLRAELADATETSRGEQ